MASAGDDKIIIGNGDSITFPVVVTDAQGWLRLISLSQSVLVGDIINVSNPGKTLKFPNANNANNSLLYELQSNGNLDSPSYAFYPYSPRIKKVYIRIGANDVIQNSTTWAADVTALMEKYSTYPPSKVIFVNIGIQTTEWSPNSRINSFNAISKPIVESYGVKYIDLKAAQEAKGDYVSSCLEDGLHPNISGHIFDAQAIALLEEEQPVTPTIALPFRFGNTPTPPDDSEQLIINTFDNVYFIKNALNRSGNAVQEGQLVDEVPNSKTGLSLNSSDSVATPRTEMLKYNPKLGGLVNLDNENVFYLLSPNTIPITFPYEVHVTGVQTSFFPYEAYINVYGIYWGEYENGFRFTNGNTADVLISPAALPTGVPFHVRLVYNANKTVSFYLNNTLLGTKNTYFNTSGAPTRLGVGTDTNNAKWFVSAISHCNRLLTIEEANNVYDAFKNIYGIEEPMPYPYIKNVGITYNSSTVSAIGAYFSPSGVLENTSLRKYRWYKAGNNSGAPDVTNNTRVSALDNLASWSKTTFASLLATDTWFRVDIECTDMNDVTFGSASGCVYVKVV